jgi:serine/threonine-protein kinase RsbW
MTSAEMHRDGGGDQPDPADETRDICIPSSQSGVHEAIDLISTACQERGVPDRDRVAIETALTEAISNAVRHGNQEVRERSVRVQFRVQPEQFEAVVRDEGPGFRPEAVPDPTSDENLTRPGGRGVHLIRHLMDHVEYCEQGNSIRMRRQLRERPAG